jgi:hypothetical protein
VGRRFESCQARRSHRLLPSRGTRPVPRRKPPLSPVGTGATAPSLAALKASPPPFWAVGIIFGLRESLSAILLRVCWVAVCNPAWQLWQIPAHGVENMVNVAQLVEHWVVAPAVAGSSPVVHPSGIRGCGGMADAHDLGSCVFDVEVRVLSPALKMARDKPEKGTT